MTLRPRLGAPGELPLAQQLRHRSWASQHPRAAHAIELGLFALAVIGGLLGLGVAYLHITGDPIADAHAYYLAADRLNHGQPLYPPGADPTHNLIYLYPPLLAVLLRPLALLPYDGFAAVWEAIVVASFLATIRVLGAGRRTFTAIGILGIPIGWALAIGQAHVPMTLLLAIGQPWSIALATDLKLFPALIALWWIGKRDWESFVAFIGWFLVFGIIQLGAEPGGTLAFLKGAIGLGQIGDVRNISPYAWAGPVAWAAYLVTGMLVTVGLARTRWGWAAAVFLGTLSPPRLLVYMLTGLLAAIRQPRIAGDPDPKRVPTAAESYVNSAR